MTPHMNHLIGAVCYDLYLMLSCDFLKDEPTTGMDPVAKRLAWNCIKFAKSKGQTIVLTSHRYASYLIEKLP